MIETVTTAPAVVSSPHQTVTTRRSDTAASAYLLKPTAQWTWQDLRDYVISEAESRFGPQPRNPVTEAATMKSFIARHGIADAVLVAKAAYLVYDGMWCQAPIKITRFTKNSDEFFALVILARTRS